MSGFLFLICCKIGFKEFRILGVLMSIISTSSSLKNQDTNLLFSTIEYLEKIFSWQMIGNSSYNALCTTCIKIWKDKKDRFFFNLISKFWLKPKIISYKKRAKALLFIIFY
jgi:hypothetical protein